jgi:hypothetical protein
MIFEGLRADAFLVMKTLSATPRPLSLYRGVFNILKITTTTHNDIVCVSFNSKSAHSNPPIYIYMQKEDSFSFPTVLGSGGCGLSLLNEMCVGTKWLRL